MASQGPPNQTKNTKRNIDLKMKYRITPLNFASAFFLVLAVYTWVYGASVSGMQAVHLGGTIGWIFLLFAVVVSFLDILLRNFFPITKILWIVQLSFITLTLIIFFIVK
jgi:hypothetical protein